MPPTLDGANTTAQWYWDNYPGGTVFPSLEKFCLHTTETQSWPGYGGGASAPNATYHPRQRAIRQHFPNNVSARALRDPTSTVVRENRDRIFQLEIVAYSDHALAQSVDGLWIGDLTDSHFTDLANILKQLNRQLGLPLTDSVTWREGQKTYVSGVRLSGPSFDAYRGILGHVHVSGNSHWDPGGFRMSKLRPNLAPPPPPPPPPEDDLPYTTEQIRAMVQAELEEYNKRFWTAETGTGTAIRAQLDRIEAALAVDEPEPPTP